MLCARILYPTEENNSTEKVTQDQPTKSHDFQNNSNRKAHANLSNPMGLSK